MSQYTVKSGDTLWAIAQKSLGNGARWGELGYSGDPRKLQVGTVLNIPDGNNQQQQQNTQQTTSTPTTSSSPSKTTTQNYSDIVNSLKGNIGSVFGDTTKTLEATASTIEKQAAATAEAKRSTIPIVQNIYSQLAETMQNMSNQEQAITEKEKVKEVGTQKAAAAAGGFETTSGFEAAQARSLTEDYNTKIGQVADKWGLQLKTLASEEQKSIMDIEAEAEAAVTQGLESKATILMNIASLKKDEQTLLQSAAESIMKADSEAEARAQEKSYNDQLLKLKERELDLTAQKIQLDAASSSTNVDNWQAKAAGLQLLRNLFSAGVASGKTTDQVMNDFMKTANASVLSSDEILNEKANFDHLNKPTKAGSGNFFTNIWSGLTGK